MELLQAESIGIIKTLTDNMVSLGLLGIGLYVIWKQNEKYRKAQDVRLEKLEAQIDFMNKEDREKMLTQIERSNEIHHETNVTLKATNKIIECFINEMHDFKGSEIWRSYIRTKVNQ